LLPTPANAPLTPSYGTPLMSDKKPTPQVEETIQVALAAAGTATDAAQEIQRLRKEVADLLQGSKRNGMILLISGILTLVLGIITVTGMMIVYRNSLNRFENITKINRDALGVFAGEITGLNTTAKEIEEHTGELSHLTTTMSATQEELKKSIATLNANQTALTQKVDALSSSNDKLAASLKQMTDDLSNGNKAAIKDLTENVKQLKPSGAQVNDLNAKLDQIIASQRAATIRQQQIEHRPPPRANPERERENMLHYP
jgi:ABC-type transporter Mla subunit MlaD